MDRRAGSAVERAMTSWLHQERFAGVRDVLRGAGAATVLDLGCGAGAFLLPLAQEPWLNRVTGVEQATGPLADLRAGVAQLPEPARGKVEIIEGSVLDAGLLRGRAFDAAVMVEVIEHLDPGHLSALERAVFAAPAPGLVVMTTPNAEFNALLGVPSHRLRHPDHRFEWSRVRFGQWAGGVAARVGYSVQFQDLGGCHPKLGGASQMAVFVRQT